MKTLRLCLALTMVLFMFAGCTSRNKDNTGGVVGDLEQGAENLVSDVEQGAEDLVSGIQDGISDIEDDFDLDGNDESGLHDDLESGIMDDLDDESSIAAAMSTDFTEIGALNAEKLGWGSGGPTDDSGRPNGATLYQDKYGDYNAYFITPSTKNVYLTFDEGYENGHTPQILDTLKDKNVKAVFFITMDFAKSKPELVTRMINEGHIIGNHSVKHLSFPDMALQEAANDIMELHDYVKATFGYEMHLFRPPMGEFSEQTLALVQSLGYKSVFWSFAYMDYDVDNQPLTIEALDSITSKCHPGAIYLLHAVSKTNADVLDEAIDAIRGQGYTFARWDW